MRRFAPTLSCLVLAALVSAGPGRAAPPPADLVGADPLGALGFLRLNVGRFALAYEHVFGDRLGVRVAADLVHVHQAADHQQIHQWTYGGSLAARWYPSGATTPGGGGFVGLGVGYRRGTGRVGAEGEPGYVALANEQLAIVPQVGHRVWLPELSLAITTALGVGWGPYTVRATNRDDAVGDAGVEAARDILGATALVAELELSFSYAF